jgi:hypothetical protein
MLQYLPMARLALAKLIQWKVINMKKQSKMRELVNQLFPKILTMEFQSDLLGKLFTKPKNCIGTEKLQYIAHSYKSTMKRYLICSIHRA